MSGAGHAGTVREPARSTPIVARPDVLVVEVVCDGFRPLTFSWTAATASERHVLEAE